MIRLWNCILNKHTAKTKFSNEFAESEKQDRDFPGGPLVKNLPCNAGDACRIPGWGTKTPHVTEQLSLRATARESVHQNQRPHIPHAATETSCGQMNTYKKEKYF